MIRLALPGAAALILATACGAQSIDSGTTSFILDGNRVYAELDFVRPDGSLHRALAYVDMGSPSMTLVDSLVRDLGLSADAPLRFRVGRMTVEVPAAEVASDPRPPRDIGADLRVEGMLPAGVLQRFTVVLDYGRRTLTLAAPGTVSPRGTAVPFRRNPRTGLIAVDATIAGHRYPVTIDNGSAYTWFRGSVVRDWLRAHPGWERGVGAVGPSNMTMAGDGAEASGILVRIPAIGLASLTLGQVGALGAGDGRGAAPGQSLFDWYAGKNPAPVIGWIGGNVLRDYRLTIDYAAGVSWWLGEAEPDVHDLDQVGITLRAGGGDFYVEAVARKNGRPTVSGVRPGDRLVRIDGRETRSATLGTIYAALHGKPGERRTLVVERAGRLLTVRAPVTAF